MGRTTLLVLTLLLAGCSAPTHWYLSDEHVDHSWGYEGEIGPEHWAELSPDFYLADAGLAQSPVDLSRSAGTTVAAPSLEFRYHATRARWVNNGHTLQHDIEDDNHVLWEGERYKLLQFHVHTPSEHTVDGQHAQAEVHFVHRGPGGNVLVVGLFVVAGDEHPELLEDVELLPVHEGEGTELAAERDLTDMLPEDPSFWWYQGSFTTPPCTEGVQWAVLKQPAVVPSAYLQRVSAIVGENNRPVMPRNGRVVRATP